VPDVWEAVVGLFRDYGYRRLRSKARLKFLVKDWGAVKFREVLEREYLKRPLIDGPAPDPVVRPIDHVGVQKLRNGLNAVGVAAIAGRVSGTILTAVAMLISLKKLKKHTVLLAMKIKDTSMIILTNRILLTIWEDTKMCLHHSLVARILDLDLTNHNVIII
jgi:sulfite reductase beta subunit-like hemoprotein